jgi:RHS repeat-associated protein
MLLQRHNSRVCRKKYRSITKYAHNAQAQRVFKTAPLYAVKNPEPTATPDVLALFTTFFESLWSPSTNPDGSTVQKAGMSYVYDEDGTLIAQTLTGGATTTWGQSARYIYLPTASGPMPVAAIYGTKHYAIQSVHLNTPRRLIQSDGQVAWQWAYSAFGEEQPTVAKNRFANLALNQAFGSSTVPAVTFNLRYPGQYFDQESNLHYNGHRSYCANCGRYTQSDPIDLQGGWNRFSYVGQNPLSFTDPFGLSTVIVVNTNGPGHTGVHVGSGSTAVLYDPGGSFRNNAKGSGDALFGSDADLQKYLKYQLKDGPNVTTYTFQTTELEEAQIKRNIDEQGGCAPGMCAICTRNVLNGVDSFKNVPSAFTPSGLGRALNPPKPSPFSSSPLFR